MDPAEFHKLALAEVEAVHRLAYHLSRSRNEADDLVQETYLRAMRAMDTFAPGQFGMRPWLFKILHNVLHTRRTRDRRRREVMKDYAADSLEQHAPAPSTAWIDGMAAPAGSRTALNADGLDQRLCRAIAQLPVAHRTVFLLSTVEDLKYREIADVVGVPVGTVMSRLSRARSALAAQLGDLASEHNLRRATSARQLTDEPQD